VKGSIMFVFAALLMLLGCVDRAQRPNKAATPQSETPAGQRPSSTASPGAGDLGEGAGTGIGTGTGSGAGATGASGGPGGT
jgi:hypothetical protein